VKRQNNKRALIWLTSATLALLLIIGGCALYVSDYYSADLDAIQAFSTENNVTKTIVSEKIITYGQSDSQLGFIFYPGGKVEHTSYEPLMMELASDGVFCILLKMPFNLAVLDVNAAEAVIDAYPDIDKWYIGGHSLGGSMAASYVAGNIEKFDGIVLLGSYSAADLSDSTLDVLSLYGSEDLVLNREKYEKYKKNMPSDFSEIEIERGCHAYFGMYGQQKGDGDATLSPDEQIRLSADHISEFIFEGDS